MKKLHDEQNIRHERSAGKIILILSLLVAILSIGRVVVANRLVETSDNLRKLDSEVAALEKENQLLTEETRLAESMAVIEIKAKEMGLTQAPRFTFLSAPENVAMLP